MLGITGALIERYSCFGSDNVNLLDPAGKHGVPKLQVKSTSSEDVLLDRAPAPGATVNGHFLRCYVLEIEPPARDSIHTHSKHPNFVKRVSRGDEHTVAGAKILLSQHFERPCLRDPDRKR